MILGAIAGWCYWYFVGCSSGTCAITSSPVNSTLYGAFMGGVLGSLYKKQINKINRKIVVEETKNKEEALAKEVAAGLNTKLKDSATVRGQSTWLIS